MKKFLSILLLIVIMTLFTVNINASDLYVGNLQGDNTIVQPDGLMCLFQHIGPINYGDTDMYYPSCASYCSRTYTYCFYRCDYCREMTAEWIEDEIIVYHHFHVTSIVPAGNKNLVTYTCINCSYSYSVLQLP